LITFPEPVTFAPPNGSALTGDEFRLLAVGSVGNFESLTRIDLTAAPLTSLTITAENGTGAPLIDGIELATPKIQIRFHGALGARYTLEFNESLGPQTAWQTIVSAPGVGGEQFLETDRTAAPAGYYRLRIE
jgi:hypothetical protein